MEVTPSATVPAHGAEGPPPAAAQQSIMSSPSADPTALSQPESSTTVSQTATGSISSSNVDKLDKQHPILPSLDYQVFTPKRTRFLICFWFLVILDSVFMPIALYFGLWYGTSLSPNTVFSIVTAALGGVSIIEYNMRFYRLWKKGSTCRVIGRPLHRWHLDFFHWVFSGMWFVVMLELIVGTCPANPPIRLLAMPATSLLWVFGLQLAAFELLRWRGAPAPVRVSSQPRGAPIRPGVYSLIEDIVAVDGGGGTAYRERLDARYKASGVFRGMLDRVSVFWAAGAVVMATGMTVVIFTIDADPAYAIGWSAPFVWAAVWALLTWWYVRRMLKVERDTWDQRGRV